MVTCEFESHPAYKMTNKAKGELVEQIVITELMKLGVVVSKPVGDNQPYDLVVELSDKLYKVQVRTAWIRKNSSTLKVAFQSARLNTKGMTRTSNKDKVDYYITYSFETNKCYILKCDSLENINSVCLQLNDEFNNGGRLKFASDYLLDTFFTS